MKKLSSCLAGAAILTSAFFSSCACEAQTAVTNFPPAGVATPTTLESFEAFFQLGQTPYSFTNQIFLAESGVASVNQAPVGVNLNVSATVYHFGAITPASAFSLQAGADTVNASVAGTFVSEEVYAGMAYDTRDLQVSGGLGGGKDFVTRRGRVDVYAEVRKKMTDNSHAFLRGAFDFLGKTTGPEIEGGVGWSF